jgi:hypothetical protein
MYIYTGMCLFLIYINNIQPHRRGDDSVERRGLADDFRLPGGVASPAEPILSTVHCQADPTGGKKEFKQ